MTKRIEAQLAITAIDRYSGLLKGMRAATGRFADGVRADMKRLQQLRGPLRLIEDFRKAQAGTQDSARALEQARLKLRGLQRDLVATRSPTEKMRKDFSAARREVAALERAVDRNKAAQSASRAAMRGAGIDTGNLAAEQRRLVESYDAAAPAMARQMQRLRRLSDMQATIADAKRRMDDRLGRAANMSFVGNASLQTGQRIIRALRDPVTRAGDLQERFIDFQNLTGVDDTRIVALRQELEQLRGVTGSSIGEMLDGLGVLVGKGMAFEDALAALPAAGRAARATRTEFDQMGASGFALFDNLKVAPRDLAQAFDIMAMGGKEGGFELTSMARKFPEITAGARALRMEGLTSVAQLTAALQIAMKSAGSEDQAATNLSNFLGKLTSPETVRRFAKMGVSIEAELARAAERGVSPFEHMLGVIRDLTDGDALKMGELFGDKQVLDFLRAMIPNLEEYERIKTRALAADGVVDADFDAVMGSFNESRRQLGLSLRNLFSIPPEVLESLTGMLQRADALVERMILWKKEQPKLTKFILLGAGAIAALAVAGGAALTAAAGLSGMLAVMRFGLVGLGARAVFAAGDLIGIGTALRGLARLPRLGLARLIAPLRWTTALVPALTLELFRRLAVGAKRLALAGLVTPLRWSARLLPNFAPALARFTAFRIAATAQMARLSAAAAWHSTLIGSAFARGLGRFLRRGGPVGLGLWAGLGAKPVEQAELSEDGVDFLDKATQGDVDRMALDARARQLADHKPPTFLERWGLMSGPPVPDRQVPLRHGPPGRPDLRRVRPPAPAASLRPVARPDQAARTVRALEAQIAALERIEALNGAGPMPTERRLQRMAERSVDVRLELQRLQDALATLPDDEAAGSKGEALRARIAERQAALQQMQADLTEARTRANRLQEALQAAMGLEVAPKVDASSIDVARAKLRALSAQLRSLPSATAGAAPPRPVGARAGGGPVRMGLPYLVNEDTPRSELFVPSRSGGILNVPQAQAVLRSHLAARRPRLVREFGQGAARLRAASLAALSASVVALPVAATQAPAHAGAPRGDVSVAINGGITVQVPGGVSDPEAIAELVAERIGARVGGLLSASHSDY